MNDKQYNELEGLRRSDLWVLNKTPLHFKYNLENPQPQTEALLFGSAIHKYILEPEDFNNEYIVMPQVDRRTKEGKEIYNDFMALAQEKDLTVISQENYQQIQDMAQVLKQDQLVNDLLEGAKFEQVYSWTDPETNTHLKVKADIITQFEGKTYIVDYKTTTSCEYKDFYRSMRKYGYDFQAGMYSEVVENNLLESVEFAFIAQEKTPPYAYRVFWVDKEVVRTGKGKLHNLLRLYKECVDNNQWQGYTPEELLEEVY